MTTSSSNSTDSAVQQQLLLPKSRPLQGEVTIPLYSFIFLLALLGNLLVIATLVQNKKMRTITNVYLLNLSISDLLLAVVCMPFTLVPTLLKNFVFGKAVCLLVRYMQGVSVGVCVFTLVAISIERYFAVCHPLRSRTWQTLRHSYRTIVVIWLLSIAIMIPTAVYQRLVRLSSGAHKCIEIWEDRTLEKIYTLFLDVVLLAIPLLAMLITYGLIGVTLFKDTPLLYSDQETRPHPCNSNASETNDNNTKSDICSSTQNEKEVMRTFHHHHITTTGSRRSKSTSSPSEGRAGRGGGGGGGGGRGGPEGSLLRRDQMANGVRAKRRTVKMLFVVVLEFFICWTPLYVLQTWSAFDYFGAVNNVSAVAMNLIHLLAFISSCCNPITYCFMSRAFRKGFIAAFFCCKRPSVELQTQLTQTDR